MHRGISCFPVWINTHHHLYQSLTRRSRGSWTRDSSLAQDPLYPIWAKLKPESGRSPPRSGCSNWPSRVAPQHSITSTCGRTDRDRRSILLPPTRWGSASRRAGFDEPLSEKDGGLPRLGGRPSRRSSPTVPPPSTPSTIRIPVRCAAWCFPPCSPFSVTPELMRESAALARPRGVTATLISPRPRTRNASR